MTLGERIKKLREEHRLTQAGLAKKLGCSIGAVSAWEQNKREPKQERKALCDFFGITEAVLFGAPAEIPIKDIDIPIVSSVGATDDLGCQAFEPFEPPYKTISFKHCKAVVVQSDSMSPIAYRGQKIIYCENELVHTGDLVFLKLKSGDQLFKRYFKNHKNGIVTLQSINPVQSYEPLTIDEIEIEFCYKVVGVKF